MWSGPVLAGPAAQDKRPTWVVMLSLSWRAASSAASFTRLASSAPLKPGVRRARMSADGVGAGRGGGQRQASGAR